MRKPRSFESIRKAFQESERTLVLITSSVPAQRSWGARIRYFVGSVFKGAAAVLLLWMLGMDPASAARLVVAFWVVVMGFSVIYLRSAAASLELMVEHLPPLIDSVERMEQLDRKWEDRR